MSILNADEIRNLITDYRMIDPVDPEQFNHIEGNAFDVRVHKLFQLQHNFSSHIGIHERRTPRVIEREPGEHSQTWHLYSDNYYLVQTLETITLPQDICAFIHPRTTLQRCGLTLAHAPVHPGFSGKLTLGLRHNEWRDLTLERGARIATLHFFRFSAIGDTYTGIWKGDKVVTDGLERGY